MADCGKCGHDLDDQEFPYADGITCPECGAAWETDWDYVREDSRVWWITGPVEIPKQR